MEAQKSQKGADELIMKRKIYQQLSEREWARAKLKVTIKRVKWEKNQLQRGDGVHPRFLFKNEELDNNRKHYD